MPAGGAFDVDEIAGAKIAHPSGVKRDHLCTSFVVRSQQHCGHTVKRYARG
jgi:hypothetical protein